MSSLPSSFLGAVVEQDYSNTNVTEVELEHGISAGIRLRSLGNRMIPVFEEQQARLSNHFSLKEWDEIQHMEKAMIVAVMRVDNAIKNLQSEAEIRDSERKAKKR